MNEVTQILQALERREPQAAEQLLAVVYDELRQLAAQKLRANGFTEHELDLLFKINPAKILGLAPPTLEQMGQGATSR